MDDMLREVTFEVRGIPVPQGSKRAFVVKGRPVLAEDAGPRVKTWRGDIRDAACDAWTHRPVAFPVSISLDFRFPRPRSHYRTGKFETLLSQTAPEAKNSRPDIDKLTRAVLDAITGIIFMDDCQVVALNAIKRWAHSFEEPGVKVVVVM